MIHFFGGADKKILVDFILSHAVYSHLLHQQHYLLLFFNLSQAANYRQLPVLSCLQKEQSLRVTLGDTTSTTTCKQIIQKSNISEQDSHCNDVAQKPEIKFKEKTQLHVVLEDHTQKSHTKSLSCAL